MVRIEVAELERELREALGGQAALARTPGPIRLPAGIEQHRKTAGRPALRLVKAASNHTEVTR